MDVFHKADGPRSSVLAMKTDYYKWEISYKLLTNQCLHLSEHREVFIWEKKEALSNKEQEFSNKTVKQKQLNKKL